jgi:hypothetical protein
MATTTQYLIDYKVIPTAYPVDALNLYYRTNKSSLPAYQLAQSIPNPVINQVYTFDTNTLLTPLYSHEVYDFIVESECPEGVTILGDRHYMFNPICNVITVTPLAGPTFDITWDSYIDPATINPTETSLKEYVLEWKPTAVAGPWDQLVINAASVIPANLPTYTASVGGYLSFPFISGTSYDFKLTTKLNYNFYTVTVPISTDVLIDFCIPVSATAL